VDKLERDLARLTALGLVACDMPYSANDAIEAVEPANEPTATPGTVRLGWWRPLRGIAFIVSGAFAAIRTTVIDVAFKRDRRTRRPAP
jgi:hypothetical protein